MPDNHIDENPRLFSKILTAGEIPLIFLSSDLIITEVSSYTASLLNIPQSEFIKKHYSSFCRKYRLKDLISPHLSTLTSDPEKVIEQSEIIKVHNKKTHTYHLDWHLFPILNNNKKITGYAIVGKDVIANHEEKMYLENIISLLPGSVYWKDRKGIYLGCNEVVVRMAGVNSAADIIGKTDFDLCWKDTAAKVAEDEQEIMRSGVAKDLEITGILSDGTLATFLTTKAPLRDQEGKIIGIVATSLDISDRKRMEEELKEAAYLKIENEAQKNLAREQEKFVKTANQVAHDIRSPLASLLMIVKSCKEIPEADRIALREAAVGISDIANNLLSRYRKKEPDEEGQERQAILVSTVLMQILTEKKYQYQNLQVKFDCHFGSNSYFSFIKISPSALKRMLSNLVNNAVDAFEKKPGKIDLNVEVDSEWVKMSIQDNGKGMPKEIVDKILQNIAVTAGKEAGHGIGLTQVREALENNQGEMTIDSQLGTGTKITLIFPRIKTPHWIAEEIAVGKEDIIVVLDDDTSIHGAWDAHFEPFLQQETTLQLKHFTVGSEALAYVKGLSEAQKKKVFLLTDYELLKQDLNGLHIVAQSGAQRSILVTSHYADPLVQNQAAKTGTRILPKQLASEIPIRITEVVETEKKDQALKSVDLVIIDDDEEFVKALTFYAFSDKTVDEYHDPNHFLSHASKYAKDTAICLDNNFNKSSVRGLDVAKILHEQGFTRIYILSGEQFDQDKLPNYVTVIRKDDIDRLQEIS